jgi:hypothetical protein
MTHEKEIGSQVHGSATRRTSQAPRKRTTPLNRSGACSDRVLAMRLIAAARRLPAVRVGLVARARRLILDGQYETDPRLETAAEGLLRDLDER